MRRMFMRWPRPRPSSQAKSTFFSVGHSRDLQAQPNMHYPIMDRSVDESLPGAAPRPEVRLFWTGPPLSPYEELSLRSFVAAGARVLLYATNKDLAVPEGVERIDAREILSGQVHQFTFADGVRSP